MSAQGFVARHIGPNAAEIAEMLGALGLSSLEALTEAVVPASIRMDRPLDRNDVGRDGRVTRPRKA